VAVVIETPPENYGSHRLTSTLFDSRFPQASGSSCANILRHQQHHNAASVAALSSYYRAIKKFRHDSRGHQWPGASS